MRCPGTVAHLVGGTPLTIGSVLVVRGWVLQFQGIAARHTGTTCPSAGAETWWGRFLPMPECCCFVAVCFACAHYNMAARSRPGLSIRAACHCTCRSRWSSWNQVGQHPGRAFFLCFGGSISGEGQPVLAPGACAFCSPDPPCCCRACCWPVLWRGHVLELQAPTCGAGLVLWHRPTCWWTRLGALSAHGFWAPSPLQHGRTGPVTRTGHCCRACGSPWWGAFLLGPCDAL